MRVEPDVAKLLGRVALLAALVFGSMAFLMLGPFPYKHQLAMLIDKRVMMDSHPAPRVILVGGSNLMFGVDSGLLSRSLGVRVVNMGVFGGLGISAPLEVTLPQVRKGDTVILVPEYTILFTTLSPFGKDYYRWFLAVDPAAAWRLYYSDKPLHVLLSDFFLLVRDKVGAVVVLPFKGNHSLAGNGYMRYMQVVNQYGDGAEEIRPAAPDQLAGRNTVYKAEDFKLVVVDQLNDFSRRLRERGARVLLTFGVFPFGEYEGNRNLIDALEDELRTRGDFHVVGAPKDFLFPYEDFSDSVNHLQAAAREERTRRLVRLLAQAGVGTEQATAAVSTAGAVPH